MPDQPSLEAQLQAIRDGFAADLPRRLAAIEQGWTTLASGGWSGEILGETHRLVHNLTGAGKTFGFADISDVARDFEVLLKVSQGTAGTPEPVVIQAMQIAFEALKLSVHTTVQSAGNVACAPVPVSAPADNLPETASLLYLVEDDAALATDLTLQLRHYGYRVEQFSTLAALEQGMALATPQAMLVDFYLPDGEGASVVQRWGRNSKHAIPVVVMSASAEIEPRLLTVRTGADVFLAKPIDIIQLTEQLGKLITPDTADPYRVLVIDDVPSEAQYVQARLQEAGMLATAIHRPLQALDVIHKLDPDVIVLDMHMPDCTGLELAAVIRQYPVFAALSIIFLTSSQDEYMSQKALACGADDFLKKPVEPLHLVSTVASRAKRARGLRALMTRDSLTGLLSHIAIVDRLESEVARNARNHSPLCVALIDIDHFKTVNDTYGHLAGDQVIKSLSHLLRQRLRRSDSLGRMGGEEFLVVMPDTREADAERFMNEVREHFAQLVNRYQQHVIRASFSCGVASFAGDTTTAALINAADQAMYRAKHDGRNRVVTAATLNNG